MEHFDRVMGGVCMILLVLTIFIICVGCAAA
jgi:hypothetical protein